MKKLLLTLAAAGTMFIANAQDGNNICVWNALNTFKDGGGSGDLERAVKCSDEASVHESTSVKSKTWFYRGQLFTALFLDSASRKKYPTAGFEAIKAFNKLHEMNDPKFKDWSEVDRASDGSNIDIQSLASAMFNAGIDNYNIKDFNAAYKYFYSIKDINNILTAHKKQPSIDLDIALKNAAIAADNSGKTEDALKVYKDWMAIAKDSIVYSRYVDALKKSNQRDEAMKIAEQGLAKYPKDPNLLVQRINFFLEDSNYTGALGFVSNLLAIEPKNDGALFIKGLAFEKLGKEDSVVYYYTRATEINPKNNLAWNNLGAFYVSKAKPIVEQMNKLGNSAADTKMYDELKKQTKELYLKAKPYLQKAVELSPEDQKLKLTLNQINLYTAE